MLKNFTRIGAAFGGVALSSLVLSACGGSTTARAADIAQTGTTEASSTAPTVLIDRYMFGPDMLTVPVGTAVTWTNNDADEHTVVAMDKAFRSGALAKGQSFSFTFAKAGTYHYLCSIHPFMVATVTVTR
jgi:plastocyanin